MGLHICLGKGTSWVPIIPIGVLYPALKCVSAKKPAPSEIRMRSARPRTPFLRRDSSRRPRAVETLKKVVLRNTHFVTVVSSH